MQIELRKRVDVRPYPGNPRLNDAAVGAVADSLRQFGFRKPIVVDADGVVICGHTCLRAAELLELELVPVHVAVDLTPDQVRAYRIADNKTGELAEWDFGLLRIELEQLQGSDVDLGQLGFAPQELAELLAPEPTTGLVDPDDVPAPPDVAETQRGDLWILGEHRLFCGDSCNADDVDRLLGGATIHLVHMDPPYNVKVEPRSNNAIAAGLSSPIGASHHQGLDVARHPGKAKATGKQMRAKDRPLANDFVSDEAFDKLLAGWFGSAARVLAPGRGFYIWGGYANLGNYPSALKAAGLYFSQAIIWIKEHPVLTRKDFMGNHEWCLYGWREGAAHQFYGEANVPDTWSLRRAMAGTCRIGRGVRLEAGDGSRIDVLPPVAEKIRTVKLAGDEVTLCGESLVSDVWSVKKVPSQKMVHLTEKPVELATRAMELSSRPGENVLDLFGGSGSTLIGAEQQGRRAFLMELDPPYCDVIVRRWEAFTGKRAERRAAAG